MKRLYSLTAVFAFCLSLSAVNYCAPSSWGYAGNNVTGGGEATPVPVTTESELTAALTDAENKVVIITQDIEVTHRISVHVNNLTLMALPGKKLISNKRNREDSGILIFKSLKENDVEIAYSNNIILRNLTLIGPGAYDCNGYDLLSLESATNVWVDHCDFQDGMDGNFDLKNNSDNISVTWCRFRYFKDPIPHGEGGDSDDHRFSNLIGSSATNKPQDGTFNITYGYCWWDEGCKQRMTRCRNCELHFLNCYWNSSVADYYIGPENASCYFEGCTFGNAPKWAVWWPFNGTENSCKFVNCSGNPSNSGSVSAPGYTYDKLTASKAVTYVTNETCGAGATLTVTTTGKVSSSCSEEQEEETPKVSKSWIFSDSQFTTPDSLTIDAGLTIDGLTLGKNMVIDKSNRIIEGVTFTYRLKTTGTGDSNKRYLSFEVGGNCTIEVYLISASTSTANTRYLDLYSDNYGGTKLTSFEATEVAAKRSYSYTGDAATLYLGSREKGINLYAINLIYAGSSTGTETIEAHETAKKILIDNKVYIMRGAHLYDLSGQRIQ